MWKQLGLEINSLCLQHRLLLEINSLCLIIIMLVNAEGVHDRSRLNNIHESGTVIVIFFLVVTVEVCTLSQHS